MTEYLPLLYIGGVMAACLVFLLILRVTGIEAADKRRQRARAARLRAKMMAEAEAARYRHHRLPGLQPTGPDLGPTSYGEVIDPVMREHYARREPKGWAAPEETAHKANGRRKEGPDRRQRQGRSDRDR